MSTAVAAELSILLVADSRQMIRKTLRSYRAGIDPARLEIVVAAFDDSGITEDWLRAEGFVHARVVDAGAGGVARAETRAVRAASAPYVVFAQAHVYPRPGFVDLIAAARESGTWTVIGPSMANANPKSAISRAALRIGYGAWIHGGSRRRAPMVPGHNSAYDREALLSLGDSLEEALPAGCQLQVELALRGHDIYYEPAACMELVSVSRPWWFLVDQFRQGRRFAGERRLRWSLGRRLAYAAGAPLIPFVRLARIIAQNRRADRPSGLWSELPALFCGLMAGGAGECVGYLIGKNVGENFDETALHRLRYVREEERALANAEAD
jgi:hypothetical protein